MATSVPAPMATPMSARVRAGASLMPSPTIAVLPCALSLRISSSLPSGRTPAMTSSTPACLPIAFAVRSLSPVSMTTRMPMFCSSRTACGLSSLITSATAMTPSSFPSRLKYRGVLPASLQVCACCLICAGICACAPMKVSLPPQSGFPSKTAFKPFPGSA